MACLQRLPPFSCLPGANAISTASGIRARLTELSGVLPEGMTFTVPFDTAPFVKLSILKVVETFVEAMVLVFFVMLLFLHKIRCTLIPAIVAPVALLGTFTVMLLSGYSINILTMFGMILAIGIIVDDAIVVVENVERLMEDKKCLHRMQREKRCVKLRRQSLVLRWCSLRCLYQWPLPAVLWVLFIDSSAFRWRYPFYCRHSPALTLTPALCATLLKPHGIHQGKSSVFSAWFNAHFHRLTSFYATGLGFVLKRTGRMMMIYAALCLALFAGLSTLPSSFLPDEDQGYFMSSIQLPSDATMQRTLKVVDTFEEEIAHRQAVESNIMILGFGFSGSGQNSAMAFTTLKDWRQRKGTTAQEEADHIRSQMANVPDAVTMSLLPPAISDMGTSSGFTYYLQDRGGKAIRHSKGGR